MKRLHPLAVSITPIALLIVTFALMAWLTGCPLPLPTVEDMGFVEHLEKITQSELRGCMVRYGMPKDKVWEIVFDHRTYWLPSYQQVEKAVEFAEPARMIAVIPTWRECTDRAGAAMYSIRNAKYPGIAIATMKYRRAGKFEEHKALLFFYKPTWDRSPHILLVELIVPPCHADAIVELDMSVISHIANIEM